MLFLKNLFKIERLIETYLAFAPRGFKTIFIFNAYLVKRQTFYEKSNN